MLNHVHRPIPEVSIVCVSMRADMLYNILQNFTRQQQANAELILMRHKLDSLSHSQESLLETLGVRVYAGEERDTLGGLLNCGFELARGAVVLKWDDDDFYGSYFVAEAVHNLRSYGGVVGKGSWLCWIESLSRMYIRFPGACFREVDTLAGGTIAIAKSLAERIKFPELNLGEDQGFLRAALAGGYAVHATSPFNYVQVRRADVASHAWSVSTAEYLSRAIFLTEEKDFRICDRRDFENEALQDYLSFLSPLRRRIELTNFK